MFVLKRQSDVLYPYVHYCYSLFSKLMIMFLCVERVQFFTSSCSLTTMAKI